MNEIAAIDDFLAYCRTHPEVEIVVSYFDGISMHYVPLDEYGYAYKYFTVYRNPYYGGDKLA